MMQERLLWSIWWQLCPHLSRSPGFRHRPLLREAAIRNLSFANFALNVG